MNNTVKNIGWIECRKSIDSFQYETSGYTPGTELKKICFLHNTMPGNFNEQFPGLEIVGEKEAIINDHTIDLVLVTGPGALVKETIGQLLKAGKRVQVID